MGIVASIVKADDERTIHLALSLAKLLEHRPSVVACEDEWVCAVDRIAEQLITQIGKRDGISVMLRSVVELNMLESEVRKIVPSCPAGKNVWLDLLEWSRAARSTMLEIHHERELNGAKRLDMSRECSELNAIIEANHKTIEGLRKENAALREKLPPQIKIIDLGD